MASAVTRELTSRVFSGLIQMFGKQEVAGEKLQRLEMLIIKIHSAVEAFGKLHQDDRKHEKGNTSEIYPFFWIVTL